MRFHETTMGVYFDDLDAFQIMHNARYLLLIERTIGGFWSHLGWSGIFDPETNPDQSHVVAANHIEYRRPFRGTGEVRVRVWVERLGNTSLTFGFRVLAMDEDVDLAVGTRVVVHVDHESWQPTPWTDRFRESVKPYCAATT
ncbi:MAG: thioesterase family protein [Myxococcota bacterium]|jgi:acyl-CoA thioester hydrolase|nr:thioesterase family protein [Myxococcota bacterium]